MPTYRVPLNDGRSVRVDAADPESAALAAQDYQRAKPLPGARGQAGYVRARERIGEDQAAARKARNPFGGFMDANGLTDFTSQIARSTGASDEVAGGLGYVTQGAENLFRRVTGQPIVTTAEQAKLAAMDMDREAQAKYARENPGKNALATTAGVLASGRPTGAGILTNPFAAGGAAAVQAAPFALARQKGDLGERLPGAAKETALAYGLGAAGTAVGARLARSGAAARNAPPSPQRQLAAEGVQLTPGQMAGGSLQRIEDGMTSVPVVGDAIRDAQRRGVESFGRAAINRTLAPVGQQLAPGTNAGRDAIGEASRTISNAYDNALQGVSVSPGRQFSQGVQRALFSRQLPEDAANEVNAVIENSLVSRLNGGPVDGNTWKAVDAELRAAADAAQNASGQRPSMRYAAQALREIRQAWQAELQTAAPQAFTAVRAADEATANLARVRQAGQYTGTAGRGGLFTPADLNRAVQAGDNSAGNRAYSQGEALMQDLTDPAMEVLPSTVPDSGTPFRSVLTTVGGLGGLAAGGSAVGAGTITGPAAVIGGGLAAAGALVYSRPVQTLLNAIYRATTPGAARERLGQLAQWAARDPNLVPVYEEAARALGVPTSGPSRQQAQPATPQ